MEPEIEEEVESGRQRLFNQIFCCSTLRDGAAHDMSRTSCRHLVTYFVYLTVTVIVAFGPRTGYQYHLNRAISVAFTERVFSERAIYYNEIASVSDVWSFLSEVAIPNLFPTINEGGENASTSKYIINENYLLGHARLRQLRVRNDSCKIHEDFRPYVFACYDKYSSDNEDRTVFGLVNGTAWTYHASEELDGSSFWGLHGFYEGSGYYEDFGPTYEDAERKLYLLIDNHWIRRATRVVFMDFTVYNTNLNLFSIVKFIMELPATGGVWPSIRIQSVKLLHFVNAFDYFLFVCEIIFCVFTTYYLFEEFIEIRRYGMHYFKFYWNFVDLCILFMSLACIIFNVYRFVRINEMLDRLLTDSEHYPSFVVLGMWQMIYEIFVGVLVFFSWVKVFKYMNFNKTMTQLSNTLTKCAKDVSGFAVMFFIVFLAYAQLGYLVFGTQLYDFSQFHLAIFTLFRTILGDFDFNSLQRTYRIMGPIYFFCFIFCVFFVLLNMFLAIISDAYSDVKSIVGQEVHLPEFVQFLKKIYAKIQKVIYKTEVHRFDSNAQENESNGGDTSEIQINQTSEVAVNQTDGVNNEDNYSDVRQKIERLSNGLGELEHEMVQVQEVLLTKLVTIQDLVNTLITNSTIERQRYSSK